MEEGAIPFSAIVDYANMYGIIGDEFDDFLYFIRLMDRTYLTGKEATDGGSNKNNKNIRR